MIYVDNALPRNDAVLGIVRAEGLRGASAAPGFAAKRAALLAARQGPLREAEEAVRTAVRDLLRNGSYKPTGRGKPASEYLVRDALLAVCAEFAALLTACGGSVQAMHAVVAPGEVVRV